MGRRCTDPERTRETPFAGSPCATVPPDGPSSRRAPVGVIAKLENAPRFSTRGNRSERRCRSRSIAVTAQRSDSQRTTSYVARLVSCVTIGPAWLTVPCTTSPRRSRVWTSAGPATSIGTDPCRHRSAALLRAPIRQRGAPPRADVPRETSRVVRKTKDERHGPSPRQNSYDRRCPAGLPAQECNRGQLHTAEHSRLRPPIMVRPTPPQAGSAIVSGPHHRIEPMPRR